MLSYSFGSDNKINQRTIDNIVHFMYSKETNDPTQSDLDHYQNKLKLLLYETSFNSKWHSYMHLLDERINPDTKKMIMNLFLAIDKWDVLGFQFVLTN